MESPEACPQCHFVQLEQRSRCPYCGFQLATPRWKKAGAWLLLLIIVYIMVRCHLRLLEGFDQT